MRWREPEYGAERTRSRWLWWPLWIGGEARWLEYATWIEQWSGSFLGWQPERWVD